MIIPVIEQPLALVIFVGVGSAYALLSVAIIPYVNLLPDIPKYALYFVVGLTSGVSYLVASHLLWEGAVTYYTIASFALGGCLTKRLLSPLEKRIKISAQKVYKKFKDTQDKRKRENKKHYGNNKKRNNEQKNIGNRNERKRNPNKENDALRRKKKRKLV